MATQIAAKMGLDAGKRVPANFIPLGAKTGNGYGVYLLCPRKDFPMKLRYLSPPPPQSQNWFDFVARSGAILTGAKPSLINMEAKRCIEKARSQGELDQSVTVGSMIVCDVDSDDGRAEILLTR